jgi:hypothetical protein
MGILLSQAEALLWKKFLFSLIDVITGVEKCKYYAVVDFFLELVEFFIV